VPRLWKEYCRHFVLVVGGHILSHCMRVSRALASFVDSRFLARSSERFFFWQYFVHFVLGWIAQQRSMMTIAVCSTSSHVTSCLLCV
jgi:hypothetical protein